MNLGKKENSCHRMIENEKFYLKDQVKQVLKGEQTSIGKLKYQKKHKMTNFTLHKAIFN